MKWLESLAEKQGAKAEELITNPGERTDAAPTWATQTTTQPVTPPTPPVETPPVVSQPPAVEKRVMAQDDPNFVPGPLSPVISGPGTSASEQDDAMKWLESLAEKQGAKAEELITNPADRVETAPDWLESGADSTMDQPVVAASTDQPTIVQKPVMAQDDDMKWLESLVEKQDAKPEELFTNPGEPADVAPTWATQTNPEPALPAAEIASSASQDDDTMAWLQGLGTSELASQAPVDAVPQQPDSQSAAARMPWEQEETPAQPVEESLWEPQVPPVAEQNAPEAESQPSSDVSEWLKNLDVQDQGQPASSAVPVPASADELPDWLNRAPQGAAADDDLPDWLKDQSADEQPAAPAPAAAWVPASPPTPPVTAPPVEATPTPAETPQLIFSPPLEAPAPPPPQAVVAATPPAGIPASTPTPTTPVQPPTPIRPTVRQTGMLGDKDGPALQNARQLMAHGGLDAAISGYTKLIKRAKFLEEVIYDLKEATYTHPVDVVIWQTLGDAHMRNNQLQEALDAYTKAEELLR
jgi:hypothetical protein